jgi:hypothetical protein
MSDCWTSFRHFSVSKGKKEVLMIIPCFDPSFGNTQIRHVEQSTDYFFLP